ncbi:ParB/RepB/Spo0J family partition protein [Terrihabitans soli]|nr:ParB/RepB/Spo0J family partition protein [Terrihabitans soli]
MADEAARPRLGRGLAALIGDVGEDEQVSQSPKQGQKRVPIEFLRANLKNPRKTFGEDDLQELSASVKEKGVLQPILVRAVQGANNVFEIIAGERRWRAAQRAGIHDVPVVVLDIDDKEALEVAIVENVQRSDLNAVEEAAGYQALISAYGHTQDALAKIIGKSRSHIANTLRLLKLPDDVKAAVLDGKLSAGHARALINNPDPSGAAKRIIDGGLSVRDAEALGQSSGTAKAKKPGRKDEDTTVLEKILSDALGLNVEVAHKGPGGQVIIRYSSLEQLDEIARRLKRAR